MASEITCDKHIPRYSPAEVYEVGSLVSSLPVDFEGFNLEVSADRFAEGVGVKVGFVVARQTFRLEGAVTRCNESELIVIEAKKRRTGSVAVWLALSEHEDGGTNINYGVGVDYHWSKQVFEPLVDARLKQMLPEYADMYGQNVLDRLDEREQSRPQRRRRKAA